MKRIKHCKKCGKKYLSTGFHQDFCSIGCRNEYSKNREKKKNTKVEQLCWSCKNACGGCSWSSKYQPIEGWEATHVYRIDAGRQMDTYSITACPEFAKG